MTECIRGECEPKVSVNSPGDPGSHLGNQTTEIPVVASPLCVVAHCHLIEKIAYISTRWYTASSYVFSFPSFFLPNTPFRSTLCRVYHASSAHSGFGNIIFSIFDAVICIWNAIGTIHQLGHHSNVGFRCAMIFTDLNNVTIAFNVVKKF